MPAQTQRGTTQASSSSLRPAQPLCFMHRLWNLLLDAPCPIFMRELDGFAAFRELVTPRAPRICCLHAHVYVIRAFDFYTLLAAPDFDFSTLLAARNFDFYAPLTLPAACDFELPAARAQAPLDVDRWARPQGQQLRRRSILPNLSSLGPSHSTH